MGLYSAIISIASRTLRSSFILLFPALGEGISERAGVLNVGVEGYMITGALVAYYSYLMTGSIWIGFLMAMLAGAILSLVHSFFSITLRCNQIVSGIGIWLLGMGFTTYISRLVGEMPAVEILKPIAIPLLEKIPLVGPILFNQNLLTYIGFITVPILAVILYRTPWGLQNKGAGGSPLATDMAGHNVFRIRYISTAICGLMSGLGGGYLAVGILSVFSEGMTVGRGFIALAVVIFGGWDPKRILGAALFFTLIDAMQLYLQASGSAVPYPFLLMMPYVLTLIVLVAISKRAKNIPRKLTIPYARGEE